MIMTREEEIYATTQQFVGEYLNGLYDAETLARKCAKWADEHLKNPWRDAKTDPPKDTKPVIGYAGGHITQYVYSPEEKIWAFEIFLSDAPDYWMPIPEFPKED